MEQVSNKILVISEGPPPLGDTVAEGGALRAWGLARGLVANEHNVTFAYRSTFQLGDDLGRTSIPDRLEIATWDGEKIQSLLDSHRIIVLRYAMGEAAQIVSRLNEEHILVADSYIPISVEVAARRSSDPDEQLNFLRLQNSSAYTMRRADYILYASPSQKLYYLGYLSGLNKLNPSTYDYLSDRLLEIPYGIDPEDRPNMPITTPEAPTLLWYGAFYSWFDIEPLIESIKKIKVKYPNFKLFIAGAKNPYNKDPGLLAHYEKTIGHLKKLGDTVEYIPWGPYDERFQTYAKGSAIITYNHLGLENLLAWRTRLMDFVLSDRPILTNGGDPLGEDLIRRGIAFKINDTNLPEVFEKVIADPPERKYFNDAAERYSWVKITETLSDDLKNPSRMINAEMEIKLTPRQLARTMLKKILHTPVRIMKYLRKKGIKRTIIRIVKGK